MKRWRTCQNPKCNLIEKHDNKPRREVDGKTEFEADGIRFYCCPECSKASQKGRLWGVRIPRETAEARRKINSIIYK